MITPLTNYKPTNKNSKVDFKKVWFELREELIFAGKDDLVIQMDHKIMQALQND